MSTRKRSHKAQMVIDRLAEKLNRQVVGSLVACVHCGNCTDSCHYVLANPDDPTYAPAYKADKIRKLFKRHYDWTGRILPKWVGAKSLPMLPRHVPERNDLTEHVHRPSDELFRLLTRRTK